MLHAKFLLLVVTATLATVEHKLEPRISQGHDAERGQFPFYAFLQIEVKEKVFNCGGSLISDQWVVTAAHCLKDADKVHVHLGTLRVNDWNEYFVGRQIQIVDPDNLHIYPKYSLLFFVWNDIGLVKLPEPAKLNDVVQPIPFSCTSSSNGGENVIAIGNGMRSDNDLSPPSHLQYTELQTISNLSCLKTFPYLMFRKSTVCVIGEEKRSTCDGDSGGPLITLNNTLLGLTSFGRYTCQDGSPNVFTKISQYTEWIEEVSGVKCKN